jgi:zinc protease
MRRALAFAAAIVALASPAVLVSQTTTPVKFEVAGIPVIYKPVRANDVIAVRLYLQGGSANLNAANAGIEALMLETADKGTAKYSKDAFNQKAVGTGTNIGSTAGVDYSVLTLQGVRQHWETSWDLFSQAALHPTFPSAEVELVRAQMINGVRRISDDPDSYLTYLADSLLYVGHPYAIRPGGTVASLTGITRAALEQWHRTRMTKENLVIVVVGNVNRADLTQKIAATFGKLPGKGGTAVRTMALGTITPELFTVKRELPTNYIVGQFAAPSPADPDYAAFRVAIDILGDRLFEEVRTKRNLTYAVGAGLETRVANRGRLYVTAVQPDTTVRVIFTEVRRLQNEPIPAKTLAENVNVFLTSFWAGQQTAMGQAQQLGLFELVGGGYQNLTRFVENVKRVTPGDVERVAKRYLTKARFVVIGDPSKVTRSVILGLP